MLLLVQFRERAGLDQLVGKPLPFLVGAVREHHPVRLGELGEPAGPGDSESDASRTPSETSVPSDAEGDEIDETSSTNTADNAI